VDHGQRGVEVAAFMSAPLAAPVELHDAIILRFGDGSIGSLSGGSSHSDAAGAPENELDIHVIGRDGQFELSIERGVTRLLRADGSQTIDLGPAGGAYDCVGPPLALVKPGGRPCRRQRVARRVGRTHRGDPRRRLRERPHRTAGGDRRVSLRSPPPRRPWAPVSGSRLPRAQRKGDEGSATAGRAVEDRGSMTSLSGVP